MTDFDVKSNTQINHESQVILNTKPIDLPEQQWTPNPSNQFISSQIMRYDDDHCMLVHTLDITDNFDLKTVSFSCAVTSSVAH